MPLPNIRLVVLGAQRADKEFTLLIREKKNAQREVKILQKELEEKLRRVRKQNRG